MEKINLRFIVLIGILVTSFFMMLFFYVSGIDKTKTKGSFAQVNSETKLYLQIGEDLVPIPLKNEKASNLEQIESISIQDKNKENIIEYNVVKKDISVHQNALENHPYNKEIKIFACFFIISLFCLFFSICFGE